MKSPVKKISTQKDYSIAARAPMVAEKWKTGQFVVFIIHPKGERIPMSLQKAEAGKITMFKRVE